MNIFLAQKEPPHFSPTLSSSARQGLRASLITSTINGEANTTLWIMSVLLPFCYCWVNEAAIGCIFPAAANPRGHSQEGDIHHSDVWMLWGKERVVCLYVCNTVLMYQTLPPSRNEAQAAEICIVL